MSVFWRDRGKRDAFPLPPIPPNSMANGMSSIRRVDLSSADSAMQKVAIFSSINLLASMASMMPVKVYNHDGDDRKQITPPAWFNDIGASGHGTSDFIYQMVYSWGTRGNVVGLVASRDSRTGNPTNILLQHPDDVRLSVNPENRLEADWYIAGKKVDKDLIWHRRRYPIPGRVMGLSPIALHATTIGLGMSALNFGAQWFIDGAHPSSILTNDRISNIDKQQATAVKERFIAAVRGTREPVVLGGGWHYQQIQIAPAESQFLETQKYTASECARIYGPGMPEILGYDTGHSMTYMNVEQQALNLLIYTLDPWFTAIEAVLSDLLPRPWKVELDRKALLRSDLKTRFEANQISLRNAWTTINEVRKTEGEPPVPWGDEPYMPALGPAAAAAAVKDNSVGPDSSKGPDENPPVAPAAPTTPPKGTKP